jgi:uncharacterized protein (TIGR02284 family)
MRTHGEEIILANPSSAVEVLRELINTCHDGEKGFAQAAEKIRSADLKSLFRQYSAERAKFADQLEVELGRLGEEVHKDEGHVSGALHRTWLNVKESLGADDHSILESVEQAEDTAKESYQKALQSALPDNVMTMVRQQAEAVFRAHDGIRALRDQRAA